MARLTAAVGAALGIALCGCGDGARHTIDEGFGPSPALPPPDTSLIPTVEIAPAVGWSEGEMPVAAEDLTVTRFASGLVHPRWLYVLPNGDVLVAETNAPPRPEDDAGIRGWIMRTIMSRAGAAVPSPDRITLLRDADGDGKAEVQRVFLAALHSPLGMALVGDRLYVADTDALLRFPYTRDATRIDAVPQIVAPLPAGPINHHWTKNVVASQDGRRLYVTVGSNSNVGENGIEQEKLRGSVLEIEPATGKVSVFASGLRNPNGLAWEPGTGKLWTIVNERDELGGDLVPDYLTSLERGGFYGWPYSYYGGHLDARVQPQRPDLVAKALVPEYALGPHTASLGLAFNTGDGLPSRYRNGAFIGQHGSWNRRPLSGYKVIFIPFVNGRPRGPATDVLTGFLSPEDEARGRPVGVAIDARGGLLVADDVGDSIWRVTGGGANHALQSAND